MDVYFLKPCRCRVKELPGTGSACDMSVGRSLAGHQIQRRLTMSASLSSHPRSTFGFSHKMQVSQLSFFILHMQRRHLCNGPCANTSLGELQVRVGHGGGVHRIQQGRIIRYIKYL